MSETPADLLYTTEHEWVRRTGEGTVRVGITDFAQGALGDVVYVDLPEVGTTVAAGDVFGEVESPKTTSELYAPIAAKIVAVNGDLEGSPPGQLRSVRRRLAHRTAGRRGRTGRPARRSARRGRLPGDP